MHRSQREILDDFLDFVGEKGDSSARATAARVLNRAMTAIWLRHPWKIFRSPTPFQLTMTVNQAKYSLPDYFGRVGPGQPRNLTRGGAPLIPKPAGGFERDFSWIGTSNEQPGQPGWYEIVGMSGAHTQPNPTGDALEVLSDNAADIDVVCAITGDDGNGNWNRNQVTLNGINPVAIGTWTFVDEFSKAYLNTVTPVTDMTSSRGNVTLRRMSDQAEFQKLFFQESSREHAVFMVYPKPVAADTIAVPVIRRPKRLFHDADPVPDLWEPALLEEFVIQWAINSGEMTMVAAGEAPRPAVVDLIAHDNATGPTPHTRSYRRP